MDIHKNKKSINDYLAFLASNECNYSKRYYDGELVEITGTIGKYKFIINIHGTVKSYFDLYIDRNRYVFTDCHDYGNFYTNGDSPYYTTGSSFYENRGVFTSPGQKKWLMTRAKEEEFDKIMKCIVSGKEIDFEF